jgi:hypothetical protein
MPSAHQDNGGIQVFSATQTSAQIEEALSGRGYGDFESKDYTTGPTPSEAPPAAAEELDAHGNPITQPGPDGKVPTPPAVAAPVVEQVPVVPKPSKPGVKERLRAENKQLREDMQLQQENTTRELAELRRLVTTGRAPEAAPVVAAPEPVVVSPPVIDLPKRPKREDFLESEDPEIAYENALGEWAIDCRDAKRKGTEAADRARQEQETRQRATQAAAQLWEGEVADARRNYSDFDAVIQKKHFTGSGEPLAIASPAMTHVAQNIPGGAKILYWLGTHPEEAAKIAAQTGIKDVSDARAVEAAMRIVRREFDRIEQELGSNPPAPGQPATDPETGLEDDEEDETDEPIETDPNLPRVARDPSEGRRVEQPPSRGTVDTKPPQVSNPPQQRVEPKPEPLGRVGQRSVSTNRPIQGLPPATVRELPPTDYRSRRAAEGSSAAKG